MIHSKVLDAQTETRLDNWARWARYTLPVYRHLMYPSATPEARNVKLNRIFDEPRHPNAPGY